MSRKSITPKCISHSAHWLRVAGISFISLFAVGSARTADFEVPVDQVGGYYEEPPIDNLVTFQNYFVGQTSLPKGGGLYDITGERRSFFIFDLSAVVIPVGEIITGVELILVPGTAGANFGPDGLGTESAVFTSTPFSAEAILDPDGVDGVPEDDIPISDIFMSFGMGDFYGEQSFFSPIGPMPGPPFETPIPISLSPDAISSIESKIGTPSKFVITGRLATYDPLFPGPIIDNPMPEPEFVFGLTDVVPLGISSAPILVIETIPEPSATALFAAGLATLLISRNRSTSPADLHQ